MIKRTVEISQHPAHLTVRDGQLLILRKDEPPQRLPAQPPELVAAIPCEDLGVLLVEHTGCTYSHAALVQLLRCGVATVICGQDHLPAGMLLPFSEHAEVVRRLRLQLAIRAPRRKGLWKQIVAAKVRAQAANLPRGSAARTRLQVQARAVRSGDPTNVEAQAARAYWAAWLTDIQCADGFRRLRDGPPPNNLLNYGYAVVRAAVARAVVSGGLLPAIGLKHSHRANYFCLADDLLEPLRPLVDARVRELVRAGETELHPGAKRALLEVLVQRVRTGGEHGPLLVALPGYVASLVRCLEGNAKRLEIPVAAESAADTEPIL
ncbi:MAG: type II CRISPR-associated endonuclease Cas1 [Phycisphaerales bacterium]|nr:type II CRISPR-associated endonuclease Cas1 [Phycisphaerales bacterium]